MCINITGHYLAVLITHNTMTSTFASLNEEMYAKFTSVAISIYEPDDIAYITIFTAQDQVFHDTTIMTLVIPIMITMLSGERIIYNNSSILETSIMIMIIIIENNHSE